MKPILALVIVITCAGCSKYERSEAADKAKTELVGMSKADILACAGAPAQSYADGNMENFTYVANGGSVGVIAGNQYNPNTAVMATNRQYCEVHLTFVDDIVRSVRYVGNSGGILYKDEQCGYIVQDCIN